MVIFPREQALGVKRSAPYVRMGRISPVASLQLMSGARPISGGESCLTIEKASCARASHF